MDPADVCFVSFAIFVAFVFQKSNCTLSFAMRAPMMELGCNQLAPSPPRGDEALVVSCHRARVEDVEQIEPDVGPRAPEAQDLRHTKVDLSDPLAVESARLDQVHERGLRAPGHGAPELRDDLRVGDEPVRCQTLRRD